MSSFANSDDWQAVSATCPVDVLDLEVLQRPVQEAVERTRALQLVDRRLHRRIGVPGARRNPLAGGHERVASSVARMTAVEHRDDMRPAFDDLVEQQAQLLVGERPDELPAGLLPGVEQQQVLDLARRIAERELGRRQFLAPVAGVGEQRDVTVSGLGEVRPEAGDHTVPRCLAVRQGDDVRRRRPVGRAGTARGAACRCGSPAAGD